MKHLLWFLCAGMLPLFASAQTQKYTISGHIKDAASGESLIGANVFDKSSLSGTSSNAYGFYSLTLPVSTDTTTLLFSYVGYGARAVRLVLDRDTVINVGLQDNALLDEVVIKATEADKIQEVTQMSAVSVPVEQIKAMPAFLGEVDVLKTLQLLPGVQSGNEGTSGIYVRGGGPDQNLILLDGVPVYNASHLFGFFSVFNADAINNVNLIKGGFPARYGGRLSSVLDISMKEGNMKEFHGEGSLGIVAGKLTLEGPIVKDKTSFIVSGRRTWIDLLARPLIKAQTGGEETAGYYFYDLNAKVNHRFSNRDRLYLSAYLGDDRFYSRYEYDDGFGPNGQPLEDRDESGLNWGNITSALRWNHTFTPKLFSNLTMTYSRYRLSLFNEYRYEYFDNNELEVDQGAIRYISGIEDFAAKLDMDYIPSPKHYVRFGANVIRHRFEPGALNVRFDESFSEDALDTLLGSRNTYATEFAAYVEDDYEVSRNLKLNAGLHFSTFYVNDELYTSLQPRLAARYLVSPQLSLKGSYSRMTQFIHLLTNAGVGLPTDLWVSSTDRIRPQEAHQFALGSAYNWRKGYEISLEGYYKTMDNLIAYEEGASFIDVNSDWQDKVVVGDGRSYGAELLVQKKTGRTTGWLGYTLSWSNRQFDELNFGERFPYRYDRRHDLSLAVMHAWKDRIDVSFSWVFGTGNAITLPTEKYGNGLYHYGQRNGYRMRDFHRLDASIAFKKQTRWGERSWVIAVYNAYSRRNPFYLYLDESFEQNRPNRFRQVSLFPIIPSLTYRFKF